MRRTLSSILSILLAMAWQGCGESIDQPAQVNAGVVEKSSVNFTQVVRDAQVASSAFAAGHAHAVTLSQASAQFASRKHIPADTFACVNNVVIQSEANYLYTSAELDYTGAGYGMLRARSSSVGPWELFAICQDQQTGAYSILSEANGLWVSAELDYGGAGYGMLRARASGIGPWEQFYVGNHEIYSYANGLWVSAELDYDGAGYGMLRARAPSVGPWELYY